MKLKNNKQYDFSNCLYESKCPTCNEEITWYAHFDADGTTYSATCCKLYFSMIPSVVRVEIENQEDE